MTEQQKAECRVGHAIADAYIRRHGIQRRETHRVKNALCIIGIVLVVLITAESVLYTETHITNLYSMVAVVIALWAGGALAVGGLVCSLEDS